MKNKRIRYFLIVIGIVLLGILSRQFSFIPLCIGDILYAMMAYFGLRFLNTKNRLIATAITSLLYCYSIELLQLYRAQWIITIRNTPLGHYILGQGFSWEDVLAYSFGIGIAVLLDAFLITKSDS